MIVSGHIWPTLPFPGRVYIFMIITGYLWKDGRSVRDEAIRRGNTLLRPYIAWGAILLLILLIYLIFIAEAGVREILFTVLSVLWGGEKAKMPFTAFWFFTSLWFSAVFYSIMRSRGGLYYWGILTLAILGMTFLGPQLAELPLAIGTGFVSVYFCAVGHWWRKTEERINIYWPVIAIVFGVSLYLDLSGYFERIVFKSGDFGTPVFSVLLATIEGLSFITLCSSFSKHLPELLLQKIDWFVLLTTPIILLHPLVIWVWGLIPATPKNGFPLLTLFVLSIAISIVIGWSVRKFAPPKISNWFVPTK